MTNIITTEDGYVYNQLPSGWYTDGDIEFDYNNTDLYGVVWQCVDGIYCADGDGLVTIESDEHGWFYVCDQGEPVSEHDNVRSALMSAQSHLRENYPEVYAEFFPD